MRLMQLENTSLAQPGQETHPTLTADVLPSRKKVVLVMSMVIRRVAVTIFTEREQIARKKIHSV